MLKKNSAISTEENEITSQSLSKVASKIDLSLDRIKILCKLGNPQDQIKAISVVGTNGKYSTINALFSILKEAKLNVMFIQVLTFNELMKDSFLIIKN